MIKIRIKFYFIQMTIGKFLLKMLAKTVVIIYQEKCSEFCISFIKKYKYIYTSSLFQLLKRGCISANDTKSES